MQSLIKELQKDVLDENILVETLLRKAYLVASKLKLKDFEKWIKQEQEGYEDKIPKYRKLKGQTIIKNNYGMIILTRQTERKISESLSSIYYLYKSKDEFITFSESPSVISELKKKNPELYCYFEVSKSQLYKIISVVKDEILKWTILLEENGIIGNGIDFSENEKKIAETTTVINNYINNFYGEASDIDVKQGL